ncbi:TetR/AcrR family transcriptional regulator [Pedobacter immunditicola]|uniref:TetR/AcrR family transcriptional regulator n=1 Tax=Pedobacter immunditicola TaxID=3133440 RepID=UPI003094B75E
MENQDKKRVLIINAALNRFAHYGLAKTTMTEIAKDISFSKALLYYYFPDKLSLYVSVIEYLMRAISKELTKSLEKTKTSTDGIMMLLQKRQGYIQKYYNLMEYSKHSCTELSGGLYEKFTKAKDFELKILTTLFNKGIENGEFIHTDMALITEIFVDALSGIHYNILNKDKNIFPDKEQFKQIFIKEKRFAEVFLTGLRPNILS